MGYMLCIFSSATTANRVKGLVKKDLYNMSVVQAPKSISDCCSYALRFDERKLSQVRNVCREYQFRISEFYREVIKEDGRVYYEEAEF